MKGSTAALLCLCLALAAGVEGKPKTDLLRCHIGSLDNNHLSHPVYSVCSASFEAGQIKLRGHTSYEAANLFKDIAGLDIRDMSCDIGMSAQRKYELECYCKSDACNYELTDSETFRLVRSSK